MYDQQIKTASKQMNLSLIGAFVCFTLLGVAIGVFYHNQIINFINSIIK